MKQYQDAIEQGSQALGQYDALLQSLILSKQNAGNNVYTDNSTETITDGTEYASQGISQPSSEQLA
jgi:hypothetical protein